MSLDKQATVYLLAFVLLVGLLAGCGGGGQAEGGSQEGAEQQGQAAEKQSAPETKIAIGTVIAVKPDREKLVLRPAEESQGGKRMVFKVVKKARVTLGDKDAELADAKKGQQAQVEYVVKSERNRAKSVQLFELEGN